MSTETEQKPDKPRGTCTGAGCGFEYQLGTARSGEFKGELVIRKHNSRVGPGLCEGASKPPVVPESLNECAEAECRLNEGHRGSHSLTRASLDLPHDTGAACTHPEGFTWADDGNGHSGSVCLSCGAREPENAAPIADPAPGPVFSAGFDSEGSCGHDILEGDAIRADGTGGYLCGDCAGLGAQPDRPQHIHDDGNGGVWVHDGIKASCALPECAPATVPHVGYEPSGAPVPGVDTITFTDPVNPHPDAAGPGTVTVTAGALPFIDPVASRYEQDDHPGTVTALPFTDPAPGPAALPPISGQPEPDRDRWGRYLITGVGHTRATTFAKMGSSTYALGEWNERMLIKGLTERPDLLALAHGKDVKRDKKELNKIVDDAQTHAGNKVAANIGTAYHTFTERLDAGLMTLDQVPVQYRARCEQYLNAVRAHGLVTRPEWMERTTAVRADQVSAPAPVAGTLDRIWQLPNGELVIGDLKTGSDLSYGWAEIAVQLALYAHGVNTFGLFDWNTKTWQPPQHALSTSGVDFRTHVRTDFAIVMHLPADGDGCTLYRVDLVKGWEYVQVSGEVQSRQKDKSLASVLVPGSLGPATAPEATFAEMERALCVVASTVDPEALFKLYGYAVEAGKFSPPQLERIKVACRMQWDALNIPY